jgi:hypothetical protein
MGYNFIDTSEFIRRNLWKLKTNLGEDFDTKLNLRCRALNNKNGSIVLEFLSRLDLNFLDNIRNIRELTSFIYDSDGNVVKSLIVRHKIKFMEIDYDLGIDSEILISKYNFKILI